MQLEDRDLQRFRQDEQDEQDEQHELRRKSTIAKRWTFISDVSRFFYPVNPVHPVKFPCFDCIVPAKKNSLIAIHGTRGKESPFRNRISRFSLFSILARFLTLHIVAVCIAGRLR
jgi:hypothetical protein